MALSDTHPAASYTRCGKTIVPFNITETQVTDSETGKLRTQYEYDEAVVDGQVTKDKLIAAGIAAKYSIEQELATINNYLADKVKYEAEYTEYQDWRAGVKTMATDTAISAQSQIAQSWVT